MFTGFRFTGSRRLRFAAKLGINNISVPILVLTARNQTQQCITALNLGPDDYLAKPFELEELIARIHALGRRHRGYASNAIVMGDLVLDKAMQKVLFKGRLDE